MGLGLRWGFKLTLGLRLGDELLRVYRPVFPENPQNGTRGFLRV